MTSKLLKLLKILLGLAVFAVLGLSIRGGEPSDPAALTEQGFVRASRAIRQVEDGFRELRPAFPGGS